VTTPINPVEGAFFDLTQRLKLRVSGADRLRFLNGQMTNDLKRATASSAIAACVLSAKGKMDAHVFASASPDSFFIDADQEQREKLQSRFERYVIADDVAIEDVSARWSMFHVLADNAPNVPDAGRIVSCTRFLKAGWDVWVESAKHDASFQQLAATFSFCDPAAAEIFRIENGIPRWNRELTDEINPVEANLEESCIDYEKGCYIGQEVISRMKMSGQRNKKLSGFVSLHHAPLEPGMKLYPMGESGREVGWITSATHSKRLDREIGIGYLKRPFYHATYRLDALSAENPAASGAVRVEIADRPFDARAFTAGG
jgi:folate-binding protein YgfZ